MKNPITEKLLRSRSSIESFSRGEKLHNMGAIFDAYRLGDLLFGKCEGSSESFYDLRVRLTDGGIREASCSCPYDYGGYCKHIVAFVLTHIHNPDSIVVQTDIAELLEPLDKKSLVKLIAELADKNPDLHSWLKLAVRVGSGKTEPSKEKVRRVRNSRVDYGKQVRQILRGLRFHNMSEYYSMMGGMTDQLEMIRDSATKFLEAGDSRSALAVLAALVTEVGRNFEEFEDSNWGAGEFLEELTLPFVESIISAGLDRTERLNFSKELKPAIDDICDYGVDSLESVLAALAYDWADTSSTDTEDVGPRDRVFIEARLNILERAGRVKELLDFCLKTGSFRRYCLKQIESGEFEKALEVACKKLNRTGDSLDVASALEDAGRLSDAIRVAEKGLTLEGDKYALGVWLWPIEESQGRKKKARKACQSAFDIIPSLELYNALKKLSGGEWEKLKPTLIKTIQKFREAEVLVDVYLSEESWDQAIGVADKAGRWNYSLVEKVADAVMPYRPEWVIEVSRNQAEGLISRTDSKYYAIAARWLGKMKQACLASGKKAKWSSYLEKLKEKHPRRRALQAELARF